METIIFTAIMIAAFMVITSGVWVAIALINAISTKRKTTDGTRKFQDIIEREET